MGSVGIERTQKILYNILLAELVSAMGVFVPIAVTTACTAVLHASEGDARLHTHDAEDISLGSRVCLMVGL